MTEQVNDGYLDQIAAALAAFQAEMPTVSKNKKAVVEHKDGQGRHSYTYADLADVTKVAMPLLAKHGLSFTCLPRGGVLVGMLLHRSGQSLAAEVPIYGSTPQQIGSGLTYMRRYLLGCLTGIVTDDDDDGQQVNAAPKAAPRKRAETKADRPRPEGTASEQQVKYLAILMKQAGMTEREDRLKYAIDVVGRQIASSVDLTSGEISRVIDAVQRDLAPEETQP